MTSYVPAVQLVVLVMEYSQHPAYGGNHHWWCYDGTHTRAACFNLEKVLSEWQRICCINFLTSSLWALFSDCISYNTHTMQYSLSQAFHEAPLWLSPIGIDTCQQPFLFVQQDPKQYTASITKAYHTLYTLSSNVTVILYYTNEETACTLWDYWWCLEQVSVVVKWSGYRLVQLTDQICYRASFGAVSSPTYIH